MKRRSMTGRIPHRPPRPRSRPPSGTSPPSRTPCRACFPRPTSVPSVGSGAVRLQVRTNTIAGPERADAAILRIKETGTAIALSLDGNGRYAYLSPREGAQLAVAECCRNLSTVGAQPVAATNCLNFGNPERPEIMAQLVEAIEGMSDACRFFETPITGGNVSLYNETLGGGIYPTPVLGIVGLLKIAAPLTIPFINAGRAVVLLGGLGTCDDVRFGSTEYAKEIVGSLWGLPPALDLDKEKRVQEAMRQIAAGGLAESAHDLSDGGLAVALAECCFGAGQIGAQVDLDSDLRPEILLFHEAPVANPRFYRQPQGRLGPGGAARRRSRRHRDDHRERSRDPPARQHPRRLGNRRPPPRVRKRADGMRKRGARTRACRVGTRADARLPRGGHVSRRVSTRHA